MRFRWESLSLLALLLGGAVTAVVVGYLITKQPILALVAVLGVLVIAGSVAWPALLPVIAMPLSVVVLRVGGGGIDLTASDFVLGLAFWPAVVLSPKPLSKPMRDLLWLSAVYQALTLLTVVANPYLANTVEWFHAWLLTGGALVIGWAVGRAGMARMGLSLLLVACLFLAVPTIVQGLMQVASGDFGPVYPEWPYSMHKNFIGTLLGVVAVVAYANPRWVGWPHRMALGAFWVCAAAIGFSQSRQALVALAVAVVVVSLRKHADLKRSWMVLIAVGPVLYAVATLVRDDVASGNVHNSVNQRLTWFEDSLAAWSNSPWFGNGLRYWYTDRTPFHFQPPNGTLEVMATSGLFGLVGFAVLIIGTLVVLWRMPAEYGTAAFAVVLSRVVQGQLDLFWVSISVSVPFLIAGVSVGAAAWHGYPGDASTDVENQRPERAGKQW